MASRAILAFVMSFVCTGSIVGSFPASAETVLTEAIIQRVRKEVILTPKQKSNRPAKLKDVMTPGDALQTYRQAMAELLFNDRSLARIGEQTVFEFEPNTRNFDLKSGTVLLLIQPGQGKTRVRTPNAAAGIRGSALFVRYIEDSKVTMVGALTNSDIELSNLDGSKTVTLKAGQIAYVYKDQIGVYNFDQKLFQETSPLYKELDWSEAPLLVKEEIEAAIQGQPTIAGKFEDSPDWMKLSQNRTSSPVINVAGQSPEPVSDRRNAFDEIGRAIAASTTVTPQPSLPAISQPLPSLPATPSAVAPPAAPTVAPPVATAPASPPPASTGTSTTVTSIIPPPPGPAPAPLPPTRPEPPLITPAPVNQPATPVTQPGLATPTPPVNIPPVVTPPVVAAPPVVVAPPVVAAPPVTPPATPPTPVTPPIPVAPPTPPVTPVATPIVNTAPVAASAPPAPVVAPPVAPPIAPPVAPPVVPPAAPPAAPPTPPPAAAAPPPPTTPPATAPLDPPVVQAVTTPTPAPAPAANATPAPAPSTPATSTPATTNTNPAGTPR